MVYFMLSQLVNAHNEKAMALRACGVDAYVITTPEKRGGAWRLTHQWALGDAYEHEHATLRDLWGWLEERLEMMEMRLEERVK